MKKIVLSLLIVALAAGANAQEKQGMRGMPKGHHDKGMAIEKLNLSADQKAKFKGINEDFRKQMQALNKQDNLTVKEWRSRKESLRKEHKSKIESLFTKEQKDQLAKMKEQQMARQKQMGEKRMEMMKQRLSLTDAQAAKIKDLQSGLHEKIKSIRDNQSLAKETKKEQIKTLMKENHDRMRSVLTEEQLKKLEEARQHRQGRK